LCGSSPNSRRERPCSATTARSSSRRSRTTDRWGFAFGYELPRRHGNPSILFVYELDVDPDCRRQGIATRLITELRRVAGSRGSTESFVLTDPENDAANALYASLGGERVETVMWDFGSAET
jgi:ribosomal protein S18 acetylase RimI-like enzyme